MKMNSGVEWASHACVLLATLPEGWALSAEAMADYHDVPSAYMAKHMQALSRNDLVISQRGAAGGYRLAKPPEDITLCDIMLAIDGPSRIFRCTEIRQNGPCGAATKECKVPCAIATSFHDAENLYRQSLSQITIADILSDLAMQGSKEKASKIGKWIVDHATRPIA